MEERIWSVVIGCHIDNDLIIQTVRSIWSSQNFEKNDTFSNHKIPKNQKLSKNLNLEKIFRQTLNVKIIIIKVCWNNYLFTSNNSLSNVLILLVITSSDQTISESLLNWTPKILADSHQNPSINSLLSPRNFLAQGTSFKYEEKEFYNC